MGGDSPGHQTWDKNCARRPACLLPSPSSRMDVRPPLPKARRGLSPHLGSGTRHQQSQTVSLPKPLFALRFPKRTCCAKPVGGDGWSTAWGSGKGEGGLGSCRIFGLRKSSGDCLHAGGTQPHVGLPSSGSAPAMLTALPCCRGRLHRHEVHQHSVWSATETGLPSAHAGCSLLGLEAGRFVPATQQTVPLAPMPPWA